ncbi:MAG: dolichyl-phosphate-mannose--protein mannosyltransferase [Propioniciclava sp.]
MPPPTAQPTTIDRLRDWHPTDTLTSWAITIGIALLAFLIRVVGLGYPAYPIFDESYYAKDAWSLLQYGYEGTWAEGANDQIVAGDMSGLSATPSFVVHPPLGKWLIALGEGLFGMNSFGWRAMPLIFGSILIGATIRLGRRVARSTLIGAVAGLLLMFDGLAFTMSRMALLDIFQAAFLVMGVAAVLADRDHLRSQLADRLEDLRVRTLGGEYGPWVWWRPWRWVAGVMFGLAVACKWNSLFVLAAFGVLSVIWDVGARRLAGAGFRSWLALIYDGMLAFVSMVVTGFLVSLATWTSWLRSSGAYGRDWGQNNPDHPWVGAFGEGLASLLQYHKDIYGFHTGEYIREQTHPYDAHPSGWLLTLRPTGLDAVNDIAPGTDGCVGPENCIRVITGLGTPILWWLAAIALVVCLIWWLGGRDWRFSVPVIAAMATYLPWFFSSDRPVFFFYGITIIPFTCIGLALVLGLVLGPADSPERRRGGIIAGLAVALVAANFAFFYPIYTDQLLPYSQWMWRMWLRSWI